MWFTGVDQLSLIRVLVEENESQVNAKDDVCLQLSLLPIK